MAISDEQIRLQAEQDSAIAQALGDPERVGILRALAAASGPVSLAALTAAGLDAATLAPHLELLVTLGAIARADDTETAYRFTETPLAHTLRTMLVATLRQEDGPLAASRIFGAVLDHMNNGLAVYDAAGVLIRLNRAGERITRGRLAPGESPETRIKRYAMRRADGAKITVEDSPSGRALRGELVSEMECIIDGQHGHNTWLRCSAAPLRDAQGNIEGAIVIFADITEQRLLSQEEARQRVLAVAMISHTFSGMAVFDVTDAFHCVLHNDNFLQMMGPGFVARGSIANMPINALFEGDSQKRVRAIFEQVRATGEPFVVEEFSIVLPDDQQRHWYRLRLTALRDDDGQISGLLMVVFEITELVSAREESRRHAKELRAVIEAIPEGVMLSDNAGHFVLWNSASERILGRAFSSTFSATSYTYQHHTYAPDGRRLDASELPMMRALAGETVVSEELSYQRSEDERIDMLVSAAPVDLDDTGKITGAVSVFQDITAIKALERHRDDFLGIAAHELRTPLATILATLQSFQRRLRKRPGEQNGQTGQRGQDGQDGQSAHAIPAEALSAGIDRMYRQAQRLNKLVSDLLDTTRIRTGKLVYDLAPCDLVAVVRDAVNGQIAANPGRKITLTVPKRPIMMTGDAFRLSQVVDNLVANALKYSQDTMPVTVSLKVEDGRACLRVADRGVGIPPEELEHMFDRFYRVPGIDVQSGAGVGLGLGLHITSSIVQRHGGSIEVQSSPGKGSIFSVSLPLLAESSHYDPDQPDQREE